MVIDTIASKLFISGYKNLLTEVHRLSNGKSGLKLFDMLAAAREAVVAEPSLIYKATASLEATGVVIPKEVADAIDSLMVQRWVYLRDTTKYSIFMEPEGQNAYAVLGLTEPLRDVLGGTGVLVRTGIVHYNGSFVCDGILTGHIWLGGSYKREYSATFASLKKAGRFHLG